MQGVERQLWVVWEEHRLQRDELAKDRVVSRVLPIDAAENIWPSISTVSIWPRTIGCEDLREPY